MSETDYQPALLPTELNKQQLTALPKHWSKHYRNNAIKHLLTWRRQSEADFLAKAKSHSAHREKMDQSTQAGVALSQNDIRHLMELNDDMLVAHERLRNLENKINLQVNEINKEKRAAREGYYVKLLSVTAIVVAIFAIQSNFIKSPVVVGPSAESIAAATELKTSALYASQWKPDLLKAVEDETAKKYESKIQQMTNDIEELKRRPLAKKLMPR